MARPAVVQQDTGMLQISVKMFTDRQAGKEAIEKCS